MLDRIASPGNSFRNPNIPPRNTSKGLTITTDSANPKPGLISSRSIKINYQEIFSSRRTPSADAISTTASTSPRKCSSRPPFTKRHNPKDCMSPPKRPPSSASSTNRNNPTTSRSAELLNFIIASFRPENRTNAMPSLLNQPESSIQLQNLVKISS